MRRSSIRRASFSDVVNELTRRGIFGGFSSRIRSVIFEQNQRGSPFKLKEKMRGRCL